MQRDQKGFTLIEMLLVLVIIGIILYALMGYMQQRALQLRMDKTSMQTQQVLNAGLSFYIFNGRWPSTISELTTPVQYIPENLTNPWGNNYQIASTAQLFYVYTRINFASATTQGAYATTTSIAGTLPLAYTSNDAAGTPPNANSACTPTDTDCYVVASVNIPGQNLNNATAVNFAGMYNHGACVPVPKCPVDPKSPTGTGTMVPSIMVTPARLSGVNDGGNPTTTPHVYPISSFIAYATGGPNSGVNPPACGTGGPATPCTGTGDFWRVCVKLTTPQGEITSTSAEWGLDQILMAITRCSVSNEPSGSAFGVYTD
jgi:prepilin-type N-terminal cleavage/methylation domain-containing protein